MNEQNAMEAIAEQSSRMCSDIRNQSESFQLLIRAHDRVRQLQAENDELKELLSQNSLDKLESLQREIDKLRICLEDKDLKIQNLEQINQRSVYDCILLENQLLQCQLDPIRHKRNATAIPSEMSSPLNLSKLNRGLLENNQFDYQSPRVSIKNAKQFLAKQERLILNRSESKTKSNMKLFTFDKQNSQGFFKSPKNRGEKIIKNYFYEMEMNKTINKVYKREQEKSCSSKQNLKKYQNYCSSMQKKYSPRQASKNAQLIKKTQGNTLKISSGSIFVPCKHYSQAHPSEKSLIQTVNTRTSSSFYPKKENYKAYPTFY